MIRIPSFWNNTTFSPTQTYGLSVHSGLVEDLGAFLLVLQFLRTDEAQRDPQAWLGIATKFATMVMGAFEQSALPTIHGGVPLSHDQLVLRFVVTGLACPIVLSCIDGTRLKLTTLHCETEETPDGAITITTLEKLIADHQGLARD